MMAINFNNPQHKEKEETTLIESVYGSKPTTPKKILKYISSINQIFKCLSAANFLLPQAYRSLTSGCHGSNQ